MLGCILMSLAQQKQAYLFYMKGDFMPQETLLLSSCRICRQSVATFALKCPHCASATPATCITPGFGTASICLGFFISAFNGPGSLLVVAAILVALGVLVSFTLGVLRFYECNIMRSRFAYFMGLCVFLFLGVALVIKIGHTLTLW